MRTRGNGRTIKIPVQAVKPQLPPAQEKPRPLLSVPDRYGEEVIDAGPGVKAETASEVTDSERPASRHKAGLEEVRAHAERTARERAQRWAQLEVYQERQRLLNRILVVADNLERALAHADENDSLHAGVQLTLSDLMKQLAQEGVQPIQALGQPFDPNLHEAVASDGSGAETVADVLLTGYTLNGELLRPARVIVGSFSS
jgi:molecular chaperone GrpE